jgi:hypothetical protein
LQQNGKNFETKINLSPLVTYRPIHLLHIPEYHYLALLYKTDPEDFVQQRVAKAKSRGKHTKKKAQRKPSKFFAVKDVEELILSSDSEQGNSICFFQNQKLSFTDVASYHEPPVINNDPVSVPSPEMPRLSLDSSGKRKKKREKKKRKKKKKKKTPQKS